MLRSKIKSLDELYQYIENHTDDVIQEIKRGRSLPIFSKEDINTYFYGAKVYHPDDITIVSYDDVQAIIVDGSIEEVRCFELVDRDEIESCVWCPYCKSRNNFSGDYCEHLAVTYDALNGELDFYNDYVLCYFRPNHCKTN